MKITCLFPVAHLPLGWWGLSLANFHDINHTNHTTIFSCWNFTSSWKTLDCKLAFHKAFSSGSEFQVLSVKLSMFGLVWTCVLAGLCMLIESNFWAFGGPASGLWWIHLSMYRFWCLFSASLQEPPRESRTHYTL